MLEQNFIAMIKKNKTVKNEWSSEKDYIIHTEQEHCINGKNNQETMDNTRHCRKDGRKNKYRNTNPCNTGN